MNEMKDQMPPQGGLGNNTQNEAVGNLEVDLDLETENSHPQNQLVNLSMNTDPFNVSNLFGSCDSINFQEIIQNPINVTKINIDDILRSYNILCKHVQDVTADRDRLLCEVARLKLELDMAELKRLPDQLDSFPQKPIERGTPTQYGITIGPEHPLSATTPLSQEGATPAYVYIPQRMAPSSISSSSSSNINIPAHQQQMIYHLPPQHYQTCHQPQIIHHSNLSLTNRAHCGHYGHIQPHHHHHHHLAHGHYNSSIMDSESINSSISGSGGDGKISSNQQNMIKKNSIRGGSEILKRPRAHYELSQDLLDKQIELLERKYGGVRARNAAIVIQRAFRHYMMVKKFASITAMAKKAENRLSRRTLTTPADENITYGGGPSNETQEGSQGGVSIVSSSSAASIGTGTGSASGSAVVVASQQTQQQQQQQQQQHIPRVTIMASTPSGLNGPNVILQSRTPPTRSLSMREKRQMENATYANTTSRSPQTSAGSIINTNNNATTVCLVNASGHSSGASSITSAHPHVNLLHATESNYYSVFNTSTGLQQGSLQQQSSISSNSSGGSCVGVVGGGGGGGGSIGIIGGTSGSGSSFTLYAKGYVTPQDMSFVSSNNSTLDSSLNSSWFSTGGGNSPHTPYYSAAQIYMRPKGTLQQQQSQERKKVPPEVPKRTSSITAQQQQQQQLLAMRQTPPPPPSMIRPNGLCKTAENGSLTSVQSSGSDSSVTSAERNGSAGGDLANSSMTWKRGTAINSSQKFDHMSDTSYDHSQVVNNSNVTTGDEHVMSSHTSAAQYEQQDHQLNAAINQNYKVSETIRKRQYRVGLNLFNKKPEKGITYLIRRGFLENSPQGVARFLITRKGLSRQMIGEYLGNLQNPFNMAVLNCFALELDLSGMQVDVALRKFQAYFRMPGEAQKIERLMEVFSQRYCQCNQDIVGRLRSPDTVFVLAFAIIMLNTDLHTPNLKPERRMRVEDFIKNLRGIDDCHDIDKDMLSGIYERVKANEFKPGSDHVTQVMKVQATIVGKKPNLALPHRRLVCYCRLYEIPDLNKKERPGVHQREVFLFNDMLVITKIFSKKKCSVTYTFRNSFPLCGMVVSLLDVQNYPYCIQLSQKVDGKILITFNARNEHDRCKFAEDLKESISEMDEMETLRIEAELERQKSARNRVTGNSENRDSGVADVEVCACPYQAQQPNEKSPSNVDASPQQLKRSALSNSLLDIHEQFGNEKPQRRGSVGSLDSGMSISFQSVTNSGASRENGAGNNKLRFSISQTAPSTSMGGVYSQAAGVNVLPPPNIYAPNHPIVITQQQFVSQQPGPHHHHHQQQHPHQHIHQQQQIEQYQQQQQQQQVQGPPPSTQSAASAAAVAYKVFSSVPGGSARLPIRDPNSNRPDEGGRSTEV